MRNYHPVLLLPICWKILKRLVINEIIQFFIKNILISSSQSCFKPGNSSISQLLFITHEIYSSFDGGVKVRSVFLDNSKALKYVNAGVPEGFILSPHFHIAFDLTKEISYDARFFSDETSLLSAAHEFKLLQIILTKI